MIWDLPTSIEIRGTEYTIRSDYRDILEICIALDDPELSEAEQALVAIGIFYPDIDDMPQEHIEEAIKKCFEFISGGSYYGSGQKSPKLVDWEKDFRIIVAPVNRVMGKEIRALEYLHWWTFLSAYNEIGGDCTFAQVVSIRDKQARHKTLDKQEKEWLRRNRELVEIKRKYTEAEEELIKQWT